MQIAILYSGRLGDHAFKNLMNYAYFFIVRIFLSENDHSCNFFRGRSRTFLGQLMKQKLIIYSDELGISRRITGHITGHLSAIDQT